MRANEFFDAKWATQWTHCIHMTKQAIQLLFAYKILIEYSIRIIVLKDGSVTLSVTRIGQEEYYAILIFIQEKHLYFQEKRSGKQKLGRMCTIRCCILLSYTFCCKKRSVRN